MSAADFTPDDLAHSLPDGGMRQEFLRQLNLTPFDQLPELGRKWDKVVADLKAAAERGRQVHAYQQAHGSLPPEFSDVTAQIAPSRAA